MRGDDWNDDDDGNSDDETMPCPYCKSAIYAQSQRCPHCGNYISEEDAPPARKPWWIIIGALLALYVVYRWIAG